MSDLQTVAQYCPYCGEPIELFIDNSILSQQYIEDCRVCCRPINVSITIDTDGFALVDLKNENE